MALSHGTSVVTSGLIFYIDTNNIKSYAGPAIQNLMNQAAPVPTGTGTATGYSSAAGYETDYIPGLNYVPVSYNLIQNNYTSYSPNSTNCCPCLMQYGNGFTVSPSTQYTYGIVYRCDTGYTCANYMYKYEYNSGTYVTEGGVFSASNQIALGNNWYWAWGTFTTQSTTNTLINVSAFYYQYATSTDKLSVATSLLVAGNYTAMAPRYWPAMNTTRATTQVMNDLTKNCSITANSLTYNTDGTCSYNGSQYATVTSSFGTFPTFTVNVWIYSTSVANYCNAIDCNYTYSGTSGNIGPRLEQNSSGNLVWIISASSSNSTFDSFTVISSGMQANTWYNVTITRDSNSLISTYLNGAVVTNQASNPSGWVNTMNSINIGRGFALGGSERYFHGNIPVVQIYNRSLSPTEVNQNFQTMRNRYGI